MKYTDEALGFLFTTLFVLSIIVWPVVIVLFNLPRVIGSLTWSYLGRFPLNVIVFLVLYLAGDILLFFSFRLLFRILKKEIDENSILEQ